MKNKRFKNSEKLEQKKYLSEEEKYIIKIASLLFYLGIYVFNIITLIIDDLTLIKAMLIDNIIIPILALLIIFIFLKFERKYF